jgi:hypothetical protein
MSSDERRTGVPPRWPVLLLGVVLGATGIPYAAEAAPAVTEVTRAALDPALVAGRGAAVAFLEQEAERAATNGTVIGPDRTAYTLPAEASGRSAVTLDPGEWVEFTLPRPANAITVRYSIPDAPNGGGITAPLTVGTRHGTRTMTLTSQYSWLYNQYSFTNDPRADLLHPDWWITECQCVPAATTPTPVIAKPFRPAHFYDEQRLLLGHTYRAGDRIRLTARTVPTTIDLLDSELVGPPKVDPAGVDPLFFGADPTGRRDSAPAIERAIAYARKVHRKVALPPGVFQVNRHIVVDDVTIAGPATGTRSSRAVRSRWTGPRRTARCTPASASTAGARPRAAAATCTCPVSRSRATCASGSTPTRSTASAGR